MAPTSYPSTLSLFFLLSEQFLKTTTLAPEMQMKVKLALVDLAGTLVQKSQPCLRPCLEVLVEKLASLQTAIGQQRKASGKKDQIVDVPRTNDPCFRLVCRAGAHFTPSGHLLRYSSMQVGALSHQDPLAATTGQPLRSRFRKGDKLTTTGLVATTTGSISGGHSRVQLLDTLNLMLLHRPLGQGYRFTGTLAPELCRHNAEVARSVGRVDVAQAWGLLELALNPAAMRGQPGSGAGPALLPIHTPLRWVDHPAGGLMVQALLRHFLAHHDIQTVAALAHLGADLVTRDLAIAVAHCQARYGDILLAWGLYTASIAMQPRPTALLYESILEFYVTCAHCGHTHRDKVSGICSQCGQWPLQCVVCRVAVRGVALFCPQCGHGGHVNHVINLPPGRCISSDCPCDCSMVRSAIPGTNPQDHHASYSSPRLVPDLFTK